MIPSLLQIPSAVSDSKLHSVLPNNGKGDFQFERSTGATRINKDGLIEEVGYFSSELVQNGNFSELGAEQIINGGFEGNANNWTLEAGVTYGNNNIVFDTVSNQKAIQTQSFVVGKTYKVSIELQEYTSGIITVRMGSVPQVLSTTIGVQTWYIVATGNLARIEGTFGVGVKATLSNVSVKQVDPNDRWNLDADWTYGNNKVTFDYASSTRKIFQDNLSLDASKNYRLKFTIQDVISGTPNIYIGNSSGNEQLVGYTNYPQGSYSLIVSPPSNSTTLAFWCQNADFSITNISLVEVQGDRARLSYDITNGVVEKQPHLLLEPSSTNLYVNSEPTANEGAASGVSYVDFNWSLGFTNATEFTSGDFRYGGSVSASTVNTLSFFILMDDLSQPVVGANSGAGDFSVVMGGSVMTSGFEVKNFGNNVYRVCVTGTSGTNTSNNGIVKYNSQSSKGFKVVGWQLEQQAYATSYIPTAGTTITRAAETCNNSKPSVNSTEGVLYAEINIPENIDSNVNIALSDGTNTEYVKFIYLAALSTFRGEIKGSGNTVAVNDTSFVLGSYSKVAVSYKSGQFKLYINGSQIGSTLTGHTLPTGLDTVSFDRGDAAAFFYGKVKGLAVYNEALTDAQLIELTS